jgi:hypothetical protein
LSGSWRKGQAGRAHDESVGSSKKLFFSAGFVQVVSNNLIVMRFCSQKCSYLVGVSTNVENWRCEVAVGRCRKASPRYFGNRIFANDKTDSIHF